MSKIIPVLHYSIKSGEIDVALEEVKQAEVELDLDSEYIFKYHKCLFYYNAAIIFLMAGDNHKAIKYCNACIDLTTRHDISDELSNFSRILFLIIHLELNNRRLFPYIYRSTYRFLSKK